MRVSPKRSFLISPAGANYGHSSTTGQAKKTLPSGGGSPLQPPTRDRYRFPPCPLPSLHHADIIPSLPLVAVHESSLYPLIQNPTVTAYAMLHARIFTDSVSFVDISEFRVEGMETTVTPGWRYRPCDVAVMYGLANPPRRSPQGNLRNEIHGEHKGPIVVIESCLIGRRFKPSRMYWPKRLLLKPPPRLEQIHPYFRLAVGGALGDDADFGAQNSPSDRWHRLQSELGISLKPYRTDGRHILLIGQTPNDASLRGVDIIDWLCQTTRAIRERSDRPIRIRLHPGMTWRHQQAAIAACSSIPGITMSRGHRRLEQDAVDAWTCVTLSSGAAIDALIEGLPPICLSPANLAYRLCSTSLDDLNHPREPDREQFLCDLAYSQWSLREMADGTAWRHILPVVERSLARNENPRPCSAPAKWITTPLEPGQEPTPRHKKKKAPPSLWTKTKRRVLSFWIKRVLLPKAQSLFEQERHREALAAFTAIRTRRPRMSAAHEGMARAAERLELWHTAADAWEDAAQLTPNRKAPLAGWAKALIKLDQTEAAEQLFHRFKERFPNSVIGYTGLERIACERGDWPLAIEMLDTIIAHSDDPDALRRKALLLIRLDRMDEARAVVAARSGEPSSLAYRLAAMPLLEATHDWAEMDRLHAEDEAPFRDNWQLLQAYAASLYRLNRAEEALRLLDHSRAGNPIARDQLRMRGLILAGRHQEASHVLKKLWDRDGVLGLQHDLLPSLLNDAWDTGSTDAVFSILDRIDQETPVSDSGSVLRLSAFFLGRRAHSLAALFQGAEKPVFSPLPVEELTAEAISALPIPDRLKYQKDLVSGFCNLFVRLRTKHPAFYPDPSLLFSDALAVAKRIFHAATNGEPLSLIRLGDGEGNMLPYRDSLGSFRQRDMKKTCFTWWGGDAVPNDALGCSLADSIAAADILGFPDIERACRAVFQAAPTSITDGARNTRGLIAAIDHVATHALPRVMLTSCHIHQALSFWGLWDLLLPRFGSVSLITCHPELAGILSRHHGLSVEDVLLIPPERKYADAFTHIDSNRHYPEGFERIRTRLSSPLRGKVFLVSAGMLGKIYAMWIKQAGGIAIDIGSAADFWCGYQTRGLADIVVYRSPKGVAERVREHLENDWPFSSRRKRETPSLETAL